ncbi:TPA: VasL domain-containing protein, partial [Salmonella enterica]
STQPVTEENLPPLPELPEMKVEVHHGAVEDPEPVARATSGRTIKGFMAGVVCAAAVAAVLWWWQVYPMQQQLAQVRDTAQGAAMLWLASPELDSYGQRLQQLPDASPLQLLETGMQMMRTADSHWPESLQQQQATAQWNEILKTRAQSSPQITQWEYRYKNNWIRWITPNIKWTRYLFNNPQIMKFGVGAAAMTEGIVKGTRYSVLFSGAFHALEFIFKSEYDFADFFVDVSMDVAKLMVAQIVLKAVAGILALSGAPVIIAAAAIIVIGLFIAWGLNKLDSEKYLNLSNILKTAIRSGNVMYAERIMHDAKTMPARQFILLRTMSHP